MTCRAPHEQSLWEHQGHPLTVGELRLRLDDAPDDAPVLIGVYHGQAVELRVPLDVTAEANEARSVRVVITAGERQAG
jgi:hypothetical protein